MPLTPNNVCSCTVIDYEEFLLMLNKMNMDKFLSETEMKELFEYADPDQSGGNVWHIWNLSDPVIVLLTHAHVLRNVQALTWESSIQFSTPRSLCQERTRKRSVVVLWELCPPQTAWTYMKHARIGVPYEKFQSSQRVRCKLCHP